MVCLFFVCFSGLMQVCGYLSVLMLMCCFVQVGAMLLSSDIRERCVSRGSLKVSVV